MLIVTVIILYTHSLAYVLKEKQQCVSDILKLCVIHPLVVLQNT